MSGRYDTTGNPEDEYYPGTDVLVNAEAIRDADELLERETELFVLAYEKLFTRFDASITPDLEFFDNLHHEVFAPLYVWAGRPRTVNIAKGGTPFCPPHNIDQMMRGLFDGLAREAWLAEAGRIRFLERAAYYVCEMNAVHPFREGNGRTIRFYMDALAARACGELFDWMRATPDEYVRACVSGFVGNYGLMQSLLARCLPSESERGHP